MNFDTLFVDWRGRTSRGEFVPALITLVAVVLFYALVVKGRTAQFCLLVLLYPAFVLHARRLHDMGRGAWLLLVPVVLLALTLLLRVKALGFGAPVDGLLPPVALAVALAAALWCSVAGGEAAPNRFGAPATA